MKPPRFKSKIGGQALIEGIMMRGIDRECMAVRLPDGSIDVEEKMLPKAKWFQRCPFVRGPVNFVTTLVSGYKYISRSADKSMQQLEEEPSRFEKWLEEKLGDKLMGIIMGIAGVLGVALAIGLFVYLPALTVKGLSLLIPALGEIDFLKNILEGFIKIAIFIAYIWLTSLLKDIRRTYEYHGAEHKTITCYEAGEHPPGGGGGRGDRRECKKVQKVPSPLRHLIYVFGAVYLHICKQRLYAALGRRLAEGDFKALRPAGGGGYCLRAYKACRTV